MRKGKKEGGGRRFSFLFDFVVWFYFCLPCLICSKSLELRRRDLFVRLSLFRLLEVIGWLTKQKNKKQNKQNKTKQKQENLPISIAKMKQCSQKLNFES